MSTSASPTGSVGEHTVTFQPSGRRGPAGGGDTLLAVARGLGVEIESACGGKGTCKKCRVRVETPESVSPPTEVESAVFGADGLAAGMRLACQTKVTGNVRVFVPEESRRTAQVVRKEAGETDRASRPCRPRL